MNVPDISCEHCERAITAALQPVRGVAAVSVDIPARQVHVTCDSAVLGIDRVEAILAEEDYPVAFTFLNTAVREADLTRDLPLFV